MFRCPSRECQQTILVRATQAHRMCVDDIPHCLDTLIFDDVSLTMCGRDVLGDYSLSTQI